MSNSTRYDAIVIGSGIGGLTTAKRQSNPSQSVPLEQATSI